jgi:hypothetical protein
MKHLDGRSVVLALCVLGLAGAGCGGDDGPTDAPDPSVDAPPIDAPPVSDVPAINGLAEGVTLDGLALFQGVRVELAAEGAPVARRNAPIVALREAVVRAYVTVTGNQEITGELEIRDGGRTVAIHRDTRALSGTSSDDRASSVLSFTIPAEQMTETASLSVRLVDPEGPAATGDHPARLPRDGGPLAIGAQDDGAGLHLVLVPLRYDYDGSGRLPDTSNPWLQTLRDLFTSLYPLADVEITVHDAVPWNRSPTFTGNADFGAINGMLRDLRDSDGASPESYYYGLIAPAANFSGYCGGSCVTGQSYVVDDPDSDNFRVGSGVGFGTESSAWTAMHEIGHEFGRYHAPCDTSGADSDYPYADGQIGVWGYDARSSTFLPPDTTDFMGYCDEQWVSDYTWSALFERTIAVSALVSREARVPSLLIRSGGEVGTVLVGERTVRPPSTRSDAFYRYLDRRGESVAFGRAPRIEASHGGEHLTVLPAPPFDAVAVELDGERVPLAR